METARGERVGRFPDGVRVCGQGKHRDLMPGVGVGGYTLNCGWGDDPALSADPVAGAGRSAWLLGEYAKSSSVWGTAVTTVTPLAKLAELKVHALGKVSGRQELGVGELVESDVEVVARREERVR